MENNDVLELRCPSPGCREKKLGGASEDFTGTTTRVCPCCKNKIVFAVDMRLGDIIIGQLADITREIRISAVPIKRTNFISKMITK